MSLTHPKLRTTDRDLAVAEANRFASETGIRHRIVIEKPDVPAKGVAFLVDEAVPTRQHLDHGLHFGDIPHLAAVQDRINTAFERPSLKTALERFFNTPGHW